MAKIKTHVLPSKLYRYRAMRHDDAFGREIAAIEEGYLWCSRFRDLNDPMEGLYEADETFQSNPQYRDIRSELLYSKLDIGICSLSESGTNELMWAHYADQFAGLCVEYDLQALLDALSKDVDLVRVHYDDRILRVALDGFDQNGLGRDEIVQMAKRILSCKHWSWLYEREWRVLGTIGRVNYKRLRSCVTGVRIGPRMPSSMKKKIERALQPLNIPVSKLAVDGYRLSV